MKLKSATALIGAATSLALLTSACSGDTKDEKSKVTEIGFWSPLKGSKDVVDAFNKTHPGVQVKFSEVVGGPDGLLKLTSAVKAGNGPDLATVAHHQLPDLVSQGLLQDVSAQAGETVKTKYPESVQSMVNLGGKTWGVPYDAGAVVLYYRKDLFEKHKIEVPKTWAEYKTAGEKIKKIDKDARILSFGDNDWSMMAALNWQAGAKWFGIEGEKWKVSIDSPEARKVADYWQGMLDAKLVFPLSTLKEAAPKKLAEDKVWTDVNGAWHAGYLQTSVPDQKGKWATTQLPTWDGQPASAMIGGSDFVVPKGSKKADAAMEFAQWMTTTPEAIQARLAAGTSSALPVATGMADVAAKAFKTDFYGGQDVYAVAGEALETIPTGWVWGPSTIVSTTAMNDTLAKVASGDAKLSDAFAPAQLKGIEDLKTRGIGVIE